MMPDIQLIESRSEVNRLCSESHRHAVWIFKHSLACGVSSWALGEFRRFSAGLRASDPTSFAVVEVQSARAVSEDLARRFQIVHETPQALLIQGGRAVWHASHRSLDRGSLEAAHRRFVPVAGAPAGVNPGD